MKTSKSNCISIIAAMTTLFMVFEESAFAATQPDSLCEPPGYVIGFFNGVWNTEAQALNGLHKIRELKGDSHSGNTIQYELFYNQTGNQAGATGLQDLAEVFIQRAREIDATGELGQRWELFWEAIATSDQSLLERIADAFPKFRDTLSALYSDFITKSVAGWSLLLSNPPTEIDYSRHRARLDAHAVEGQRLILIAHSQGNLFVNQAYDYIAPKIGTTSVGVVHIAPASPTLRGNHVLANIDLVIKGLRAQGLSSVPANNLTIPPSLSDWTGHKLVETYLDATRAGRATIAEMIEDLLGRLQTPANRGNVGFFTVTLTWDGPGDVDLHTFEPSGAQVYYAARLGQSGYLDVDNVIADGPEHYYASCSPSVLQAGIYRIGINNYSRATGRIATVQVSSSRRGEMLTRKLGVGAERGSSGNNSPIYVFTVTVTKNPVTGMYSVSAQ